MTYVNLSGYNNLITNWTDYTPTITGYSGTTFTTYYKWRRNGSNLEILGQHTCSGGGTTTSVGSISLPSGLSADISIGRDYIVGNGWRSTSSSGSIRNFSCLIDISSPTVFKIAGSEQDTSFNPFSDTTNFSSLSGIEELGFQVFIPIQGWSV
jgi:hypothetical protein